MTEATLIQGQPYPTLPGWEDLSGYLTNGWALGDEQDNLRGFLEPNTATIIGRLRIGNDRVATVDLPSEYRTLGNTSAQSTASVRSVGSAEVEVWGRGVVVLPHNSIAPGSRAQHYEGDLFIFTISYPRRAV